MVTSTSLGCGCNSAVHVFRDTSIVSIIDATNARGTKSGLACFTSGNSRKSQQGVAIFSRSSGGVRQNCRRSHYGRISCTVLVRAVLAEPATKQVDQLQSGKRDDLVAAAVHSTSQTALPETIKPPIAAQRPEMGLAETSLNSTLQDRLWVLFGCSVTAGVILKGVEHAQDIFDFGGLAFGTIAAYVLADLGTGIYHWGVDNYGGAKTPIFGSQIDAFQGHHKRPWTITKREFCNNTQAIARPVGIFLLPFLVLPGNSAADAFFGVLLGLVIMSQQIHSWAHCKKSNVPIVVNFLQERGILVSRKMHGAHHRSPYSINYCIVSGLWNSVLNESKFFPWLESIIYSRWRIAPRCWADSIPSEWLQEGSYFEDGSDLKVD